ncbi:MAG: DUF4203 domain-containing protein [Lachnospiraceae bacterium]|nr:DUF4203 domain-containing protein [Lachnospiraceae bacterium]
MEGLKQNLLEFAKNIVPNVGTATTIAIIISILLALFYCFFGYKLLRLHISFIMFMVGALIGLTIGVSLRLDDKFILAAVLVLGILLAVLGFFLYKVGIFFIVTLLVGPASYGFISDIVKERYVIIICIAIAVLFAVLACFFVRPVVIIATALSGGLIASNNLIDHFLIQVGQLNSARVTQYIVLGFALILALFGMIFQFRTTENYEDERTGRR